jgi:superfamily II DNA or RNA helicase
MAGAKKIAGEWSSKEVEERGIKITCDVVKTWQEKTYAIFGRPRKTIVFCAGVKHGLDLAQQFGKAGYNFISISYKDTDKQYRSEVFEEFSKPDSSIHGLIATDILTKGFDCPDVMIGISARPFSKSFSSHVQQIGRITRSYPGKDYAVLIDHAGNYGRFYDQWEDLYNNGVSVLDDGAEKAKQEPTKKEKEERKCPKCGAYWEKSDTCVHCGFVIVGRSEIIQLHGKVEEFVKPEKFSSEYKEQFFRELLGYARETTKKDGWAFHKYKEKFGVEPKWKKIPILCTVDTRRWIQSRNIARSYVLSR